MRALGLKPMSLGLDLRGGVYFLYEVDVQGAVQQLLSGMERDYRQLLRNERIPFTGVAGNGADGPGHAAQRRRRDPRRGAAAQAGPEPGRRHGDSVGSADSEREAGARRRSSSARTSRSSRTSRPCAIASTSWVSPSRSSRGRASIASSSSCRACRTRTRRCACWAPRRRSSSGWSTTRTTPPRRPRPSARRSDRSSITHAKGSPCCSSAR